jgi:alpha-tubulin suppressor-like RCC1 family protein
MRIARTSPTLRGATARALAVAVTAAAIIGCQNDRITQPETSTPPEPQGLIVSSPMPLASASGGTGGVIASQESVVFVSLMPGTALGGVSASVRNRAKGVTQTVSVIEDGFDPIGIMASVGDTIEVTVTNTAATVVFQAVVAVRSSRRPAVVRTNPPTKKADASLNMTIQVVFSAPIDSTTLTRESVQLLRGTTPVPGTLQFSNSANLKAEFRSTNVLDANTSYRLSIAQTIRDLNHLTLESPVDVEFTTEKSPLASARLVFTVQPTNTTAGVPITPAVVVAIQDASGTAITSASGDVAIGMGTGSGLLSGAMIVRAVNGVATFDSLVVTAAGTDYTLVAVASVSPTLTSSESSKFSVVPAAASKFQVGGPSSVEATMQFAVSVRMSDAFGNSLPSTATNPVTVSLSSNPGGATLAGTLTVAMRFGAATFANLTIDRPGVGYVLQATSGTLSGSIKLDVWNLAAFAAVSAGGAHTCAVTRDRFAYCWGANANGQVGAGNTIDYASPVLVASGASTVSAGGSHTCGMLNGRLYCWGLNDDGQLGDGTRTMRSSPAASMSAALGGVVVGGSHTCANFLSAPWDYGEFTTCWGSNAQGQLGELSNTSQSIIALAAGGSHTCGTDYGPLPALYCWGSNKNGQLGAGTQLQFSVKPLWVASIAGNVYEPGLLSAGGSHTCATITVQGTNGLFCWGLNDHGQLGDGTTLQRTTPALVSGGPFSSVTAGGSHTCALTSAGAAYCWGANDHGQLGDGTTTMRTSPVVVAGGHAFVSISAGGNHTCGVTVDGTYCWGANGNGQLGNGTTSDSPVPVRVSGQ